MVVAAHALAYTGLSCLLTLEQIKCDRKSCIKRGESDQCKWETKQAPPPPQVFALASDVDSIDARLRAAEQAITRLSGGHHGAPPPFHAPAPIPVYAQQPAPAPVAPPPRPAQSTSTHSESYTARDADTEDAALALEEIAVGQARAFAMTAEWEAHHGSPEFAKATPPSATPQPFSGPQGTSCRIQPTVQRFSTLYAFDPARMARRPRRGRSSFAQLQDVWAVLPPPHLANKLVDWYFANNDWAWHIVHEPCFRSEVAEFHPLTADPAQRKLVDPAWLALYCAILCVSATHPPSGLDTTGLKMSIEEAPTTWLEVSLTARSAAQWSARPQIRIIQTVLACGPFLLNRGAWPVERAPHLIIWTSAAIRIGQLLGLHALGDDPNRMPADDPAFPSGASSLKRELAKRLWYALEILDWTSSSTQSRAALTIADGARGGTYAIQEDQCTTAKPLNVNDSDLSSTTTSLSPRSPDELTDWSFEICKWHFARIHLRRSIILRKDELTYEAVLELDRECRESIGPIATVRPGEARPWLRASIISALHNRLIHLHRPFAARAYQEPGSRYQRSVDVIVESSHAIVESAHACLGHAPANHMSIQVHALGASVSLAMAVFHDLDTRAGSSDGKLADLRQCLAFFDAGRTATNTSVRSASAQGRQVVQALLDAISSRQHRNASTVGATVDSFAQVFLSIAQQLAARSSIPSAPTSPVFAPTLQADDALLMEMGLLPSSSISNRLGAPYTDLSGVGEALTGEGGVEFNLFFAASGAGPTW